MEHTRQIREYFGLTQKELSDVFGIPLRTITNWDNRQCMPHYIYVMMKSVLWHAFFELEDRLKNDADIRDLKLYHESFLECIIYVL